MITPSVQPNLSALNPEPGNPGESEESVHFNGHSISRLPSEVLPGITRYLSMREVLVLGQVCRELRSKLEECGVITDIWNYLSLPKNKRSIYRLVTGNRPLIDHLRNNPAGYRKSFPIQHSPAIYTKYASHFREQMVRASSVTIVSSISIDASSGLAYCRLNDQHNCLIHHDFDDEQLHIWTKQKYGFWEREHTFDLETFYVDFWQHGTDILIFVGEEAGKVYLSFVKRNELGKWNVTQKQYLDEISPLLDNHCIFKIHLAQNQRLMLCVVSEATLKSGVILIFCLDTNGQWLTKGSFPFCADVSFVQLRFSQDCRHVAVFTSEQIFFVSEQDDGTWIDTGEIKSELAFGKKNLNFNTDDHHFVAWGEKTQLQRRDRTLTRHSHVIIASRDEQGNWSEILRITRASNPRILKSSLYARFSTDGKQLFIWITNRLIILSLHEGKWVFKLPDDDSCKIRTTIGNSGIVNTIMEPDGSDCKIRVTMDPSLFMVIANEVARIYVVDASGVWAKQHEFLCSPYLSPIISSGGDTVVCPYGENRHIDFWTCRHSDQWVKQKFAVSASQAEFSPDGSLVALASACNLILLGLTEQSLWQEKGRQSFGGHIKDLSFSPCGRSIRVDFKEGKGVVITFWQIVPQEWQDG